MALALGTTLKTVAVTLGVRNTRGVERVGFSQGDSLSGSPCRIWVQRPSPCVPESHDVETESEGVEDAEAPTW